MSDERLRRLKRAVRQGDPRARRELEQEKRRRGLASRAGAAKLQKKARSLLARSLVEEGGDGLAENLLDSSDVVEETFGSDLGGLPPEVKAVQDRHAGFFAPHRISFEAARCLVMADFVQRLKEGDKEELIEDGSLPEGAATFSDSQLLNAAMDLLALYLRA